MHSFRIFKIVLSINCKTRRILTINFILVVVSNNYFSAFCNNDFELNLMSNCTREDYTLFIIYPAGNLILKIQIQIFYAPVFFYFFRYCLTMSRCYRLFWQYTQSINRAKVDETILCFRELKVNIKQPYKTILLY